MNDAMRQSLDQKVELPTYFFSEIFTPSDQPFYLKPPQTRGSLYTASEIDELMKEKCRISEPENDDQLVWQLFLLRQEGSPNLETIMSAINSEKAELKFSPQQLFEALIEVSSYKDEKLPLLERASQIYSEHDISMNTKTLKYFLTSFMNGTNGTKKEQILRPLLLKANIRFDTWNEQNIDTMEALLEADENVRQLQVSVFEAFLSSLTHSLQSNKPLSQSHFEKLVDMLENITQNYYVAVFYNQSFIRSLSSQLTKVAKENALRDAVLVRLLGFFYKYIEGFDIEFEAEFFRNRLLKQGNLLERFSAQELVGLVKSFSSRVKFKAKTFEYMAYSKYQEDIPRSIRIDAISEFYAALIQEFKKKGEKGEVVLEIFKQQPSFFKLHLTSLEELKDLRSKLLQDFNPKQGANYEGLFKMLCFSASIPNSANEQQKVKQSVLELLKGSTSYEEPAQIASVLASRVALLSASQYYAEIEKLVNENKHIFQPQKKSVAVSKLSELFRLTQSAKSLFSGNLTQEQQEDLEIFLYQNSCNLMRYISFLLKMDVHFSEDFLSYIKPKALTGDAIDKFCKFQLKFGKLKPQAIALLTSNLKTLDLKEKEAGIHFNFQSAQIAQFEEEVLKKIKEDYLIVFKSILQVYKKFPELKSSNFSSAAVGWLVSQLFTDLSESQKIVRLLFQLQLSLDLLGKTLMENYLPELVQALNSYYTAQKLHSMLKGDQTKYLLALVELWPSFIPNPAIIDITAHLTELKIPTEEYLPLLESLASMNVIHQPFIENTLSIILGIRNNEQRTKYIETFLESVSNLGYGVQNMPRLLAGIINTYKEVKLIPQQVLTNFFMILVFRTGESTYQEIMKLEDRTKSLIRNSINESCAPYTLRELLEICEVMFDNLVESLISFKTLEVENAFTSERDEIRYFECIESNEAIFDKVLQDYSLSQIAAENEPEQARDEEWESEEEEEKQRKQQVGELKEYYSPRAYEKEQNLQMRNYRDIRSKLMERQLSSRSLFANIRGTTNMEEVANSHQLKTFYVILCMYPGNELRKILQTPILQEGRQRDKTLLQIQQIENPWILEFQQGLMDELIALRFHFALRKTARFNRNPFAQYIITVDKQCTFALTFNPECMKVHVFKKSGNRTHSTKGIQTLKIWHMKRELDQNCIELDQEEIEQQKDFESWKKEGAALAYVFQQKINDIEGSFDFAENAEDRNIWF